VAREAGACFQQGNTPSGSHQSIDCPSTIPWFFLLFFTLVRLTWLVFVVEDGLLGGLGEEEEKTTTVRK
jgi:hypothetical protein